MNEQTTNRRAVEHLATGDHVSDANGVHEVQHRFPYKDGNGRPSIAVTLRPLGHGDPWVARHPVGEQLRLATDDEVQAYQELDSRNALANGLYSLGALVQDQQLPVAHPFFSVVLDTPEQVRAWAKAGGVDVKDDGKYLFGDFTLGGLNVHAQATHPTRTDDAAGPVVEEQELPRDWHFTFGAGQEFDGRYVVVRGTFGEARATMNRAFGHAWCAQYETLPAECAGLTLLLPSEWPVNVDDDLAAVDRAFLPTRDEQPRDGHVYSCCGKTGRISRHQRWCPTQAGE